MGLDIYAYGEVTAVEAPTADELDDVEHFYLHGGVWADREDGVPHYARCGVELAHTHFSYSGYYEFRQRLGYAVGYAAWGIDIWAKRSGEDASAPPPEGTEETLWIWKLINYSDCEGAFGPAAAGKIAAAMIANREKFTKYHTSHHDRAWWEGAYQRLLNVFAAAANHNGVVKYC